LQSTYSNGSQIASLGDVEIRDASENKMANVRQLRSKAVLTSYK